MARIILSSIPLRRDLRIRSLRHLGHLNIAILLMRRADYRFILYWLNPVRCTVLDIAIHSPKSPKPGFSMS
jgi:hypothetical protein